MQVLYDEGIGNDFITSHIECMISLHIHGPNTRSGSIALLHILDL